jgi:hypothetical protein
MHERTFCAKTVDAISLIRKGISGISILADCLNLVIVRMWAESGTTEEEGNAGSYDSSPGFDTSNARLWGVSFDAAAFLRRCEFLC